VICGECIDWLRGAMAVPDDEMADALRTTYKAIKRHLRELKDNPQ
jgi:hypothetical protein